MESGGKLCHGAGLNDRLMCIHRIRRPHPVAQRSLLGHWLQAQRRASHNRSSVPVSRNLPHTQEDNARLWARTLAPIASNVRLDLRGLRCHLYNATRRRWSHICHRQLQEPLEFRRRHHDRGLGLPGLHVTDLRHPRNRVPREMLA